MSSPATTAYIAAAEKLDARMVTLALIELTTPSALTLRFATSEVNTPDGNTWQAGLICDPLRHSVGYLGAGVSPADASFRLVARPDASQASTATVLDLLSDYLWQNATVTLYLFEQSLTSASDPLQVFKGRVSRPAEVDASGMTIYLLQDQSWNVQTPPTVVDKSTYPDSPDVSQGLPIPIVYGDHVAQAMRSPWTASYTNKSKQEDAGAGLGVVPLVLVDAGVGSAAVKVVAAGHECADVLDRASGYSTFVVGENTLSPLDTAGITETLGASESYLSIADENALAYAAVIPIDVRSSAGGNTATDPRKAMDPFDETTYATLNQTAGKNELQLILPNASPLGRIESVQLSIGFIGNSANTQNLRANAYTPGVGAAASPVTTASTGTTPAVWTATWPTTYYDQSWQFGSIPAGGIYDLRIDFAGAVANNKASILWAVLVVKYRPQRSLVTPGGTLVAFPRNVLGVNGQYIDAGNPLIRIAPSLFRSVTPQFKLENQFYANLKGYKDTVGGAFTGSASALIQRPCDIANHFLQTYGSVASGDVETAADTFGSFVDARSTLKNSRATDAKMACWIGERTTVQRVLQDIASQSGMCIYQDRFTDKWLCFVWKPGATEDYGRTISWREMGSFSCEESSVVDVRHALRIKYGFDHYKSKTLYEAFVTSSTSGQGLTVPTIHDQRLTVDATNEDIDFKVGAVTYAATLAHATYTPIDLAVEARGKCRTAVGNAKLDCGYGFSIKTGFNDLLDITVGGTPYQATLNEYDYTAEGLATETARALNATSSGLTFTCTYSHSTNKFTIAASGAFAVVSDWGAPAAAQSAAHVLGTVSNFPAATSQTSETARYGYAFWFVCGDSTTTINMLWSSGASASTNAAYLMGYVRTDSGATRDNPASMSRGDRERVAETYEGYYGPKEERQITAQWLRDENTAVELRNRIFDMTASPRVIVRFSSLRLTDLRVMQVIEFDSDLDAVVPYPKYGSDGSWAGKTFRVLEIEQGMGPSYHTEVLAIEAA